MGKREDIEQVVRKVVEGTAEATETDKVSKGVKNALGANMVQALNSTFTSVSALADLVAEAVVKFREQWEMNKDLIDLKSLMSFIGEVQDRQMRLLELYRKITTGKEFFTGESLTEDEKKVLKLFKSFKSKEEKTKFLKLVAKELGEVD